MLFFHTGFFSGKQSLKNRSTIFSLGNRGNILAGELEEPIIVPHAAQKSEKRVRELLLLLSNNFVFGIMLSLFYHFVL